MRRRFSGRLALGLALRRAYRRQLDSDGFNGPGGVLNDRSQVLTHRAEQLAAAGRTDSQAIEELKQLARSNNHDLLVAAHWFQLGGRDRESSQANLARRLLEAAAGGGDLAPLSAEEHDAITAVETWRALEQPDRYHALVTLEPQLGVLESRARTESFHSPSDPFKMEANDPRLLLQEVHALIGPLSPHRDDPLLGSDAVTTDAAKYLYTLIANQ